MMDLISIGEIEKVQSVSSPHEEELKKLGKNWLEKFRKFGEEDLNEIAELIGAKKESLKIDEEWALTKEFFPEIKMHLSYHYYGEEFQSVGEEDQLRFLFSGGRVRKMTGEDLAGMIEITLNYIGRYLSDITIEENEQEGKEKFYEPRKGALEYLDLDDENLVSLTDFIGGSFDREGSKVILWKEFFPEVIIGVELDEEINFTFDGNNSDRLASYELNSLGIYTLNHVIRYISSVCQDDNLPEICRKVFPRYSSE